MQRLKLLALTAVVAVGISVVAAASASAKTCAESGFTAPCFVNKEGKELVKKKFTGTLGETAGKKTATLETASGAFVECTGATGSGEVSGTKKFLHVKIAFTGCKESVFGNKCQNTGTAGEIVNGESEGELGFRPGSTEVGLALLPTARSAEEKKNHTFEAQFVEFQCGALAKSKVKGGVIGLATPSNKLVTPPETQIVKYEKGATKGSQLVNSLTGVEGGATINLKSSLNGGAFENAAEIATAINLFEEALETRTT
jgi:hypothetical protein